MQKSFLDGISHGNARLSGDSGVSVHSAHIISVELVIFSSQGKFHLFSLGSYKAQNCLFAMATESIRSS